MPAPSYYSRREIEEFDLARAVVDSNHDRLRGSLEAEILQDATERAGKTFSTGGGFHVPFELLRRDLTAGSSGAAIVGTETPFALDVLRPYTATLRSGAQMTRFQGNASVPKVAASSTATWLAIEASSSIAESQATIGQVNMTPKNAAILVEVSEQMKRQTNINRFLQRELLRSLGGALDQAIFSGSGASGEPQGIVGTTGVGSVSGTSIDWTDVTDMLYSVAEADGQEGVAWFGTPAVRRLLSRRERVTGGGRSIWDDNAICGYPAYASRVAPTDTLIVGAFGEVMIGMFQDGIDIATGYQIGSFQKGLLSFRAWLSADIAVTAPAAFAVATSIT